MEKIYNLHVKEIVNLTPPNEVKDAIRPTKTGIDTVLEGRQAVKNILEGKDKRLLVVTGPCSIHDPQGALEFAKRHG